MRRKEELTLLKNASKVDFFGNDKYKKVFARSKNKIESIVKRKYSPAYVSLEKGYAEQDPDYYYNILIECLKDLAKSSKDKLDRILYKLNLGFLVKFKDKWYFMEVFERE